MGERASFKFFRSYYEAALQIEDMALQAEYLIAVCGYALDDKEPDIQGVPKAMFTLARPNIDASKKKSDSGSIGGSKTQANVKQTRSKQQANSKQTSSNIGDRSKDIYTPPIPPRGAAFERFWQAYPKKVGKQAALKAFQRVKVPVESLLTAIERQKCSDQWSRDNGQYIPNPATWLNQGRWEDEISIPETEQPQKPATPRRYHLETVDGEEVLVYDD